MDLNGLISEAVRVKNELDAKKAELAELNKQIAEMAQYKDGSMTGHIYTDHYHVKVAKRRNIKWDQRGLNAARAALGDKEFFSVFGWKFEPKNKALLDAFFESATPEKTAPVMAAMTVTNGSPSVSFEALGE